MWRESRCGVVIVMDVLIAVEDARRGEITLSGDLSESPERVGQEDPRQRRPHRVVL